MSSSVVPLNETQAGVLARLADYVELTKPRITVMVVVSVAITAFVASWGQPDPLVVLHALVGTLLTASSASGMNQWMERDLDARMPRTQNRPLPANRLSGQWVMSLVILTFVIGVAYLIWFVNPLTALFSVLTWLVYVVAYTPLKTRTPLNTVVGAISGALPILMGWATVGGNWGDPRWLALFAVVFFWQFPHFMAIAWIYRDQYKQAGMKMWPVVDPSGRRAGVEAVVGALILLPISFVPLWFVPDSHAQLLLVFVMGVIQLSFAIRFCFGRNQRSARQLLRMSLIYLPIYLLTLVTLPIGSFAW